MNDKERQEKIKKAKEDMEEALRKALREEAEAAKVKPALAKILARIRWRIK